MSKGTGKSGDMERAPTVKPHVGSKEYYTVKKELIAHHASSLDIADLEYMS